MELHQINVIRLQPLQGFVDLTGGGIIGAAVNLGHEEDFLPVAISQSLSHADFASAAIIIPAVVHEGDPTVDGAADNRYTLPFVSLLADVIPPRPMAETFSPVRPRVRWGIADFRCSKPQPPRRISGTSVCSPEPRSGSSDQI